MVERSTIANPRSHYGSAKAATRNFIVQRLTGMALVVLTVFFIWFVLVLARGGAAEAIALVRNPFVALALAVVIVTTAVHMRVGVLDIIEDYVPSDGMRHLSERANTLFCIGIAAVSLLALVKLVFWG